MDTQLKLEAPWEEVKEKLKEVHADLTDEDLEYAPGQEQQLLERVSKIIGKDIAATKGWIESVSFNKNIAS
ncbi:MAG: CsbD family protein [Bacteroidota bacterium]|nr:general stress protein CsbD [Ferruginibacter sp.]